MTDEVPVTVPIWRIKADMLIMAESPEEAQRILGEALLETGQRSPLVKAYDVRIAGQFAEWPK